MLNKVEQLILRAVDPHLGHSFLGQKDLQLLDDEAWTGGCIRFGPDDPGRTRIAVLGGSTSDINQNGSWVRPFRRLCDEHKLGVRIYSGAVAGYSSSQELIKLIRDIVPLAPRFVISLNGVNDLGFIQAVSSQHPLVHAYQASVLRTLVRRAKKNAFFEPTSGRGPSISSKYAPEGVELGAPNRLSAARFWERNVLMMRAIARACGADYLCFLQPVVGIGEYQLSNDEKESLDAYIAERKDLRNEDYRALLREFYTEARMIARSSSDFIVDLVDVFEGCANMFADVRHPNRAGNMRLAGVIFERCRKLLEPTR